MAIRTCSVFLLAALAHAQTPAPPPDTLVFADGEKLIGHFVRSNGSTVTFKSDVLGELNVDRGKIQELRISEKVVLIGKDVKLGRRRSNLTDLPQGTATITGETVTVVTDGGPPTTVPAASAAHIVDRNTFDKVVMHNPGFLEDWKGAVSAGVAIVAATQQSRTYTSSINLIRAIPTESWLDARNRTIVDFNVTSGVLNQPNTPQIKT